MKISDFIRGYCRLCKSDMDGLLGTDIPLFCVAHNSHCATITATYTHRSLQVILKFHFAFYFIIYWRLRPYRPLRTLVWGGDQLSIVVFKRKSFTFFWGWGSIYSRGDFSWEGGGTLSQKFPGHMRSHKVKENHICLMVTEILRYTHRSFLVLSNDTVAHILQPAKSLK